MADKIKYTKEQLQWMSDLEVNKLLAEILGVSHYQEGELIFTSVKHAGDNVTSISGVTNYCNNPSDIMPLAFEHKISLSHEFDGDDWLATEHPIMLFQDNTIRVSNENPLRAIACCLILVLQGKQ